MGDRYFEHIVGCLEASIKTAEDGVDCHIPVVTVQNAVDLLKEQKDLGIELTNAMELVHKKNERIKKLEEQIETLTKWRMNAGAFD